MHCGQQCAKHQTVWPIKDKGIAKLLQTTFAANAHNNYSEMIARFHSIL